MIKFDFQEYCSGCGACYNICPVLAISMQLDDEGFLIPKVDTEKCISCGKCNRICPHLTGKELKGERDAAVKGVWLYASTDNAAKTRSSSGAACYELGKASIESGGAVCGCIWNDRLEAVHIVGGEKAILEKTQGSKYVQSNTDEVYRQIERWIKTGKQMVFTGTPCQAAAAHNYIMELNNGKDRENLITVAVICHGVASPLAWESYKRWESEQKGSPLINVNFRDKTQEGYKKSYCRYEYQSGDVTYLPTFFPTSKYMEATIVYNLAMRNSCSHCDCKGINKGIDIIVGDWYAECTGEGQLGTSCIVAFTERGALYVKEHLLGLRKFSYNKIIENNAFIEKSLKPSKNREKFFNRIKDYHYWDRVEELYPAKYAYKKLFIKWGLYDILKKIL